jgi:hypothetical protein
MVPESARPVRKVDNRKVTEYFLGPQVLTLGIPLGFFLLVCFWGFFQRNRVR